MYLEVKNITKSYVSGSLLTPVLKDVSLSVEKGRICVILGPSGSGKSTLLNAIGGLEYPDSGTICVGSQEITSMPPKEIAAYRRHCLGFIFQFYNLIPDLTVRENIQVCQYLADAPLELDELLNILGLLQHQYKFPSQLSGGQQQRCSIARALIKNPGLLLCDEPTGALDSKTALEILALLEKINKAYNTTMLIVTHNDKIKDMAHQVVHILDGQISRQYYNSSPVPVKDLQLC